MQLHKQGFTLIELLVVIMIVAVLSSVALPQYQKSAEKARAAEAMTMVKSVYTAARAYYTEHQKCPQRFEQLAVEIPFTGTSSYLNYCTGEATNCFNPSARPGDHLVSAGKSNAHWAINLIYDSDGSRYEDEAGEFGCGVVIGRLDGKYKGTGFGMWFVPWHSTGTGTMPTNKLLCLEGAEVSNNGIPLTAVSYLPAGGGGKVGSYCNMFGGSEVDLRHSMKYFTIAN